MRYVVVETRGHTISGSGSHGGSWSCLSSYSVLDTAYAHREVFAAYVPTRRTDAGRLDACLRECERLNVLELGRPLARHERGALLRPAACSVNRHPRLATEGKSGRGWAAGMTADRGAA